MIYIRTMNRVFTLIFLVNVISTHAADRPFAFQKMKLGKLPANYISGAHGTGKPSSWEIAEIEVPSTLNPKINIKQHALVHVGNIKDSYNYPVLIYEGDKFDEMTLTVRLRITGGNTVQAAGIVFGAKDDKNFFYIALKPKTKQLFASDVTNGLISKGRESLIPDPKDGWYKITLTCRARKISWVINGKTYPELLAPNPVVGKVGVWTRGDTACEFTVVKIEKPETVAQTAVKDAAKNNKHVSYLQLVAPTRNAGTLSIVASSRPGDIGKVTLQAQDVKNTLNDGTIFYSPEEKTIRVTMPVRDKDGKIIAAAHVHLKHSTFGTRKTHKALASAIVLKLGDLVQNYRRLFD